MRAAKVNMGAAVLEGEKIPSVFGGDKIVSRPFEVCGKQYNITLVSMGNPHCVVFEDPDSIDLVAGGKKFENNPAFPERINTEFVKVLGKNHLKMRVWERGTGETLACGTGTCASVVASALNGLSDRKNVDVKLLGGHLQITWSEDNGHVYMTGPAEFSFDGVWNK